MDTKSTLQQLERLERAIIQLATIAADTSEQLATALEDESAWHELNASTEAFYELMDKVQFGLRNTVHLLIRSGLLRQKHNASTASQYAFYAHRLEKTCVVDALKQLNDE